MRNIPSAFLARFEVRLRDAAVPNHVHGSYKKWLRYYLDLCEKYHFVASNRSSLPRFLHRLEEKRQTRSQQLQASQAITLYYRLIGSSDLRADLGLSDKIISTGKRPPEPLLRSDSFIGPASGRETVTSRRQVAKEPHLPPILLT